MSEQEEKLYYATIGLTNRYTIGVWAKDMEKETRQRKMIHFRLKKVIFTA